MLNFDDDGGSVGTCKQTLRKLIFPEQPSLVEAQVEANEELMPPREMKWSESLSNWQVWVHRDKTRSSLDIHLHHKITLYLFSVSRIDLANLDNIDRFKKSSFLV